MLGPDGALLVGREDVAQDSETSQDVVKALDMLEAQTRELARVRLETRP